MRDVVHLDELTEPVRREEDPMQKALPLEPLLEAAEPLQPHGRRGLEPALDAVLVRTQLAHFQPIPASETGQLHGAAGRGTDARSAAPGLGEEAGPLQILLGVVRLDGRGQQRRLTTRLDQLSRRGEPIEEADRRLAGGDFRPAGERAEPCFRGAAAAQEQIAFGERLLQPLRRLFPAGAMAHERDEHAPWSLGTLAMPDFDVRPQPRARRHREDFDGTRPGNGFRLGIASDDAGRERMALLDRRAVAERNPGCDLERQSDEIDARDRFDGGRRVGEAIEAGKRPARRGPGGEEEKPHRADSRPARRFARAGSEISSLPALVLGEERGWRLDEHRAPIES